MSLKSKLFGTRISTKLLAINTLICIVFFLIVLMVFISFHHIQGLLRGVIVDDMNEVMTNALIERELSSILAETNLLLSTFFENEEHLNTKGNRLLTLTLVLVDRTKGHNLEQPLQVFAQRLGFLLEQCKVVNTTLRRRRAVDHFINTRINRLEEIISIKLIDSALKGEDISILEQLSVLVTGYRQSLLEIGKLHAETWPEKYYTPISAENDPLIAAVDDLILRFRTLMASEPEVAELGKNLISDLQTYRGILLYLNTDMVELKARMNTIENAKGQVAAVMEKLNRDVAQTTRTVNAKIAKSFWITEIALLFISVSLVIALILFTAIFFKKIIKKPMDDIRDGIEAVRGGNLEARISLNRHDEWYLIENALNTMASKLSVSYKELQKAHDELEAKVRERTFELTQAKERAEAANKELADFSYSISHDLRAPLRHIDGYLELLKQRIAGSLNAQSQDYMVTIASATRRMGTLIDSLLSFYQMRRRELSKVHVNLNDLVCEVIQELAPEAAGRNIHWQIADLPGVIGDRAMLRIVFVNLISNVLKFTRHLPQAYIEIGSLPGETSETVIFVRDNGVGFDMAYADKLFGVFQRLHSADEFEGTGIGLANVRRIIALHGGRTWAEGKVDQGATFYFSLPQSNGYLSINQEYE